LKFGADNNLVFQSYHTVAGEEKFYSLFGVWKYQLGSCWSSDKQEVNEGTTAGEAWCFISDQHSVVLMQRH